jgi:hypothetical protein
MGAIYPIWSCAMYRAEISMACLAGSMMAEPSGFKGSFLALVHNLLPAMTCVNAPQA